MPKAAKSAKKTPAKSAAKKTLIAKPKKTSKAKSAFQKEVTLFRDQKDYFTMDQKYANL